MAENYVVNYDINVQSQAALQALNNFQLATNKLSQAGKQLTAFQKKIESVTSKLNQMSRKAPVLDIATSKVNKKLDTVIAKMEKIHRLAKKTAALNITTGAGPTGQKQTAKQSQPAQMLGGKTNSKTSRRSWIPNNIGYKTLGPSMIDSGGIGALDFVKGMGIAYGISGLGSLMGKTVSEAVEYDNLITTARNILKTHDKYKETFAGRFANMERTVRNVGVETKFTAPQVADAARFLAMAGFDIEGINKSIRPIADIALVGDTDLGETADVVTNIMTGYGIDPSRVKQAADIMTMTFTKSNTTLMEIAEAYKYSASLLSAGGVDFEEATAAMGILGDAGIKGSQAGTTMRTIMANIINPTKKQLGNWERIGVARTDKNGRVRPLVEIFKDLQNADLYVDDFYKLFHKTAAQGAVSLAQNVDKWNEIIEMNFMSDSIASKLANEKKNTIQGLWYQMTSAFTETGMQVFEEMNSPIRQFLNETIDWLKTDDAKNAMREIGRIILELFGFLKNFSEQLIKIYNRFSGFIELWLQWQVKLSAILIPLRIFKGLINFAGFVTSSARSIGQLAIQFGLLGKNVNIAKSLLYGFRGGLSYLLPFDKVAQSRNISQAVIDRYNKMYPGRSNFQSSLKMVGAGSAGIIGTIGGAYLGSMVGEEGSATSMVGAGLGSILGGIGAMKFASLLPKILPLLATPVGIGVAVAAGIGTAAYHFYKYHEAIDEATASNTRFLESTSSLNGINYSEHATMADKYLSIVYNKQLDANRAIGEHINLMREQLGLMKKGEEDLQNQKKFSDTHKDLFENANKPFGTWATDTEAYNNIMSVPRLADGSTDYKMLVQEQTNLNGQGKTFYNYLFNGIDFGTGSNRTYNEIAAARLLYGLGRDTSEGTALRETIDSYKKRILFANTDKDFYAVIKDLNAYTSGLTYTPGSEYWTMSQIGKNSFDQNKQGYHYVTAFRDELNNQFMWNNPSTALANMLKTWNEILVNHTKDVEIPNDLLAKFLLQSGIDIFNSSRYGEFGSPEFMKHFGWYNNQWNEGTYDWFNPKTGKIEQITLTSEEARNAFITFHQRIIDTVNQVSPQIRPYFDSFINSPIWGFGDPNARQTKEGSKVKLNGVEYTYQNGMWIASSGPYKQLTDQEMQQQLNAANSNGGKPTPTHTGVDQSKYKSHYNNNSAAPKQVIVKIENLMNVESIDLSNPDNAAVISDLKSQLTQALVDVVHDFDETYHG